MAPAFRPNLSALSQFLRTPSVGRTVVALLSVALILLLLVNLTVFVMTRRTADFNETVDHAQEARLVSQQVLNRLVDAETGQRGFMLTAQPSYLAIHSEAVAELPGLLTTL